MIDYNKMIDYDKLNIAHDIMLKHNKYYCTFEFGWSDKVQFVLYSDEDETPLFTCCQIDDLIAKLQELTKTQPRYKIGQEVWLNDHDSPGCIFIDVIRFNHHFYEYNGLYYESRLYPTKQELVESQIQYWISQRDTKYVFSPDIQTNQHEVDIDRCQHESNDEAHPHISGYLHRKCIKCGEFYK